jgi:ATP-dependent DNA helicase MPH1
VGRANPKRIVLVVIDEAHRATGKHSFVECLRILDAHNASYRVLALSATPGTDVTRVQAVIDNLRIARLEVRGDEDLREYKNDITVEQACVAVCPTIAAFSRRLNQMMEVRVWTRMDRRLFSFEVVYASCPTGLSAFRPTCPHAALGVNVN